MPAGQNQVLLLSDNPRLVASLEGALGRVPATAGTSPSRGQFRFHRLARIDDLDRRLPDLMATIDGAIVDGTAPCFSNGHLARALMTLDRHQLGTVVLTRAGSESTDAGPAGAQDSIECPRTSAPGSGGGGPGGGELPLVWPLPCDRLDRLGAMLAVIAGYQRVVRQLHREIRLFQRLDAQVSGQLGEIDEEMRLASRIQQDFLPKRLPAVGPAQFATLYRPASWVSGDLYDVLRLDESHVGFYIADAVGHGMPAALLTMFIKRSMETKQVDEGGYRLMAPEDTMRLLNKALLEASLSANQFTTALYAVLDVRTLRLRFARGGHPHPLLLRADGATEEPQADGGLLGVFADAEFARAEVQLAPGDKFLVYSDGIEMAFTDGDRLTTDIYRDYVQAARDLPVDGMLARLVDEMDRQAGSLNPRDDVTVVALEIAR